MLKKKYLSETAELFKDSGISQQLTHINRVTSRLIQGGPYDTDNKTSNPVEAVKMLFATERHIIIYLKSAMGIPPVTEPDSSPYLQVRTCIFGDFRAGLFNVSKTLFMAKNTKKQTIMFINLRTYKMFRNWIIKNECNHENKHLQLAHVKHSMPIGRRKPTIQFLTNNHY